MDLEIAEEVVQDQANVFHIADEVAKHDSHNPFIAFEFYPPRTESGVLNLKKRLMKMKKLQPLYVDFTWGAGGTTSDLTMDLCLETQEHVGLVSNMHLTCTNMPREKIDLALKVSKEKNIKNILALRGDPPVGQVDWKPVESGFSCALDLIKYIKEYEREHRIEDFYNVSVAAYPEGHPTRITKFASFETEKEALDADLSQFNLSEAEKRRVVVSGKDLLVCKDADYEEEMKYLKQKIDAGAKMIVTQLFFDADVFIDFLKSCRDYGIAVPIIPGIMCVTNFAGFQRMVALCKTRVPRSIVEAFEKVQDDAEEMKQMAISLGVDLCRRVLDAGVRGLHFYTLNIDEVVVGILQGLRMVPAGLEY